MSDERVYKIFPYTFTGDRLRIVFQYKEEEYAFEHVIIKLQERVRENGAQRETPIEDFAFGTTLEYEVAAEKVATLCIIIGLEKLDIDAKDRVSIIPLPRPL